MAAPVLLAGQPFAGKVSDNRFGELFSSAKATYDARRIPAAQALANMYYNDPEQANDSIRAFVGVRVADTLGRLPAGWHYRTMPGAACPHRLYQLPAGSWQALQRRRAGPQSPEAQQAATLPRAVWARRGHRLVDGSEVSLLTTRKKSAA